ncbi:uncharacterized protein PHACADRAFT_150980 [Phanerochaete carnosa HHB-10118-sp]|uniref:F-box domain-containing protein n=1 Tax=Phanerochaete carnosa (strain HHB-10118-sp) TaxID=650164 RepID=K5UQE7_PHACS|nr:uncharacterized protein PHACADRAFT_150980 [Phanerochaete carnosa HHB-10118-sp]EKM52051.1 hypothetical protein PHACADRAFT_150980 [Phanerochaete carnosa HHB-10118-sp]
MSADALPVELVDKAIKFAYNDADALTLTSCALVCRIWGAVSRPYIFERVKIASDDRLTVLENLVERDANVGPFIRALIVQPSPVLTTVPSSWVGRLAKRLPSKLARLQAIRLICIFDLGEAFERGFVHEFATFATVDRLTIDKCALNLSLVYLLAAALPGLRHLHLGVIMPVLSVLTEPLAQLHPLRLTSVGLDVGSVYPYGLRDLVSEVRAPLRSITLGVLAAPDVHALPSFAPLAAHIGEALMRTLKEERVLYSGPVPESAILEKLQRELPVIHAMGVLKVERV